MEKIQFKDLPDMTTPLSSANLNQMQDNMENAIVPIKLVSISATAPGSATIGDMYYNTTDDKVYTATAENTWDSGEIPRYDGFYVNLENNQLYYYNGESLVITGTQVQTTKTDSDADSYSCNYINGLKTELYNKSTGETGNIILNDNLSNYDYIEIYYENPTFNRWGSSKIDNPNGKTTSLTVGMRYDVTGAYYTYFRDVSFDGTSITHLYGGYFAVQTNGSIEFYNNNNYIAITKVIGYKN